MKQTYDQTMARILQDEGGYSNDAGDPGGPTKYGITIHDVRLYLNSHATAEDVKRLTVDQAKHIYLKHYAEPIHYDDLPAGVDYAVMDYGVNSGISRAAKVLQRLVHTDVDGVIGSKTVEATHHMDSKKLINAICDERLHFLHQLRTWSIFGRGWNRRVVGVRSAALKMVDTYKDTTWTSPTSLPTPSKPPLARPPVQTPSSVSMLGQLLNWLASSLRFGRRS